MKSLLSVFSINNNDRSTRSFDPEAPEGRLSTGRIPYFDIQHLIPYFDIQHLIFDIRYFSF
jgi:hypothetical protein